jgi:glutaredoxin
MLTIIGTQGCTRCMQTKTYLDNKNIEYEYKLITDFNEKEQDEIIDKAMKLGLAEFPIIIKDNDIVRLEDIIND